MKRTLVNGDYFFGVEYNSEGEVREAVLFGPNYHQSGYGLHSAGIFAVAMRNFPKDDFEKTFPFKEVKNLFLSVLSKKNASLESFFRNLLGEKFWESLSYHISDFSRDYYEEIVAEPFREKIPYEDVSNYTNEALYPDYWIVHFPKWADELKKKLSRTSSYKEFRQVINDYAGEIKEKIRETAEAEERIALAKEIAEKFPVYWALNQVFIYCPELYEGLNRGEPEALEGFLHYISDALSEETLEPEVFRKDKTLTISVAVGPITVEEHIHANSLGDIRELLRAFSKSLKETEDLIPASDSLALGKIREKTERVLNELPLVEDLLSESSSESESMSL